MIQILTFEVSPQTIIGKDFIAVLPVEPTQPVPFGADQSFVDSGAINTAAGELIDDPIARPVLTSR